MADLVNYILGREDDGRDLVDANGDIQKVGTHLFSALLAEHKRGHISRPSLKARIEAEIGATLSSADNSFLTEMIARAGTDDIDHLFVLGEAGEYTPARVRNRIREI